MWLGEAWTQWVDPTDEVLHIHLFGFLSLSLFFGLHIKIFFPYSFKPNLII